MLSTLKIAHTYKEIENWDGNFCSDYCIGCGDCDHFPTKFCIIGHKQHIKLVTYHCDECFATMIAKDTETGNTEETSVEDIMAYEIDISVDKMIRKMEEHIICYTCNNRTTDPQLFHKSYIFCDRTICQNCANLYEIDGLANIVYETISHEGDDVFMCECCYTKYQLNMETDKIMKCEDIRMINYHLSPINKISNNKKIINKHDTHIFPEDEYFENEFENISDADVVETHRRIDDHINKRSRVRYEHKCLRKYSRNVHVSWRGTKPPKISKHVERVYRDA